MEPFWRFHLERIKLTASTMRTLTRNLEQLFTVTARLVALDMQLVHAWMIFERSGTLEYTK